MPNKRRQSRNNMIKKTKAYLLIETNIGEILSLQNAIAKINGVKTVNTVTGPYDMIALLEAESADQIGQVILNKIRKLPGVSRTLTCIVLS